jgi:hypothetical protein
LSLALQRLCSLSAFRERGIILARGGGRALGKVEVTKAQARADRKAFRTDARLRLKTEMGANGAMFRGYRALPSRGSSLPPLTPLLLQVRRSLDSSSSCGVQRFRSCECVSGFLLV